VKLSHDCAFLLDMCESDASSFALLDCRARLKTEMEKAVFQVTVSLNIRKDSIAETLPLPRGSGEGSSNKQLELPRQDPSSRQRVLDSRCR